ERWTWTSAPAIWMRSSLAPDSSSRNGQSGRDSAGISIDSFHCEWSSPISTGRAARACAITRRTALTSACDTAECAAGVDGMGETEPAPPAERVNAMTIDVEDYFHVTAFASTLDRAKWDSFESRVERNTRRLLDLFDEHGVKITFFVLGWVA